MSTQQWANIGDDAGAPHALLERVAGHVPVALIDYLWIFPARRVAVGESTVVVVGAFHETDRRRVITAHFTVSRNRKGIATVTERLDEHGSAPPEAVPRIVQGVLRRLGEDVGADPREVHIDGALDRWDELIVELGGRPAPHEPQDAGEPVPQDVHDAGDESAPRDAADSPAAPAEAEADDTHS